MDTESIRLFTEVIAHGGISEAARRNNLSQQTLSRRIIVLEEEVGAALLERGQHIRPTAAGKAFLDYAYEVMRSQPRCVPRSNGRRRAARGT